MPEIECINSDTLHRLEQNSFARQELVSIEQHVTTCTRCQSRLAVISESPEWKREILPVLLNSDLFDSTVREEEIQGTLQEVMALLGPTDDPDMLGRIGTYEISGVIGRGGMGVVFKAFDPSLDRFVAIKMLAPHLAASGAARKRFTREGKAAAAVVDDHVLPVYQVDHWQGIPFLVMQYSRGTTLQQRINDHGPLAIEEILRIALQIAKGLAAAHAQGLVHRDVKPSNILLSDNVERAMLTDFGLARAVDDASMTKTGVLAGTPQYMSPEQARGESICQRSDLFSLGSVIYAMCTARAPFRADNSLGVIRLISEQEPRSIRTINEEIPDWLCEVVEQLMSKEIENRPISAKEVADCLEACLAHLQHPSTEPLPNSLRKAAPKRRFNRHLAAGVLGAACLFPLITAGILIVLDYGKGTISISSEVANVPIRIQQGEKTVKELTISQEQTSVRIAAGKYSVFLDGHAKDLTIQGGAKKITLLRGKTKVVRIIKNPAAKESEEISNSRTSEILEQSLRWSPDLTAAKAEADKFGVPILIHFYSDNEPKCQRFAKDILSNEQFARYVSKYFVCSKLNTSQESEIARSYKVTQCPTTVFLDADGQILNTVSSPKSIDDWLQLLVEVATQNRDAMFPKSQSPAPNPTTKERNNPQDPRISEYTQSTEREHEELEYEPNGIAVRSEKTSLNSTFASSTGTWKLEGGVTLEIVENQDEQFGKVVRAILRWPASGNLPALRHEVDIAAQDHIQWAVAWQAGDPTLWLLAQGQYQSGSSIRSVNYGSPANIVTCVGYGDDHFDLRLPKLSAYRQAVRTPFSIGMPWRRMPKDLDRRLVEHFDLHEARYGIASLLPTGPYMAGGSYSEPAFTQKTFTFTGQVLDESGKPVTDARVVAQFSHQPSVPVAQAKTDSKGTFSVRIRADIMTLASYRQLDISCNSLNQKATCFLLQKEGEKPVLLAQDVQASIQQARVPMPKYFQSPTAESAPKIAADDDSTFSILGSESTNIMLSAEDVPSPEEHTRASFSRESTTQKLRERLASVSISCEHGEFSGLGWIVTANQIIMPSAPARFLDLDQTEFKSSFRILHSGKSMKGAKHEMLGSLSLFTLQRDIDAATTVELDGDANIKVGDRLFAVDGSASGIECKAIEVNKNIRYSGDQKLEISPPLKFYEAIVTDLEQNQVELGAPLYNEQGRLLGMLIPLSDKVIALPIKQVRTICDQMLGSRLRRLAAGASNLATPEPGNGEDESRRWQQFEKELGISFADTVATRAPYSSGLMISKVAQSSVAKQQGLRAGDVLVGLGEWMTKNKRDLGWILKHLSSENGATSEQQHQAEPIIEMKFHIARGDDIYWGLFRLPRQKLQTEAPRNVAK